MNVVQHGISSLIFRELNKNKYSENVFKCGLRSDFSIEFLL